MSNYKRISIEEREEISIMLSQNYSLRAIARSLDRNVSSISRETRRFSEPQGKYRAIIRDQDALKKASSRRNGLSNKKVR